ncbi:MAG TPA: hypothetical protein EYP09_02190, partial [Anaerolineae bacterium]|nr:hypothetical protein [Anaerolineae bacterium]
QLRGTAARMPLVAGAFTVALAGLAGIPPLAGFAGKWFVLSGGVQAADAPGYLGLIVFLLNSLLALGYYLPLIGMLFARKTSEVSETSEVSIQISPWMALPLVVLGALVLAMGLYPGLWLNWTAEAAAYLHRLGK